MNIFLDTADKAAIEELLPTGLISGITTNPTSLAGMGTQPLPLLKSICDVVPAKPVSIEVTMTDPKDMYNQAHRIAAIAPNVVVKIPCALLYYPVIKKLVDDGISVNVTLVCSVLQSLFMGQLGVTYISFFIGRLEDAGIDAREALQEACVANQSYGYPSHMLAASVRTLKHMEWALMAGADCVTIPPALFKQAADNPVTNAGLVKFNADWKRAYGDTHL